MEYLFELPEENRPSNEERARGMCIKNACRCGVCGGGADKYNGSYVCQENPNHLGDIRLGMFSDHTLIDTK